MSSDVVVVILAGGEGSRIGGAKPLKALGGERLIDRALRQARSYSDVLAVAVRNASQAAAVDAKLIEDAAVEGPLGGLIAGLRFAKDEGCGLLLVIPADMPFLPRDLLKRLSGKMGSNGCAIAGSGGRAHPVCSLWRVQVVDRIPRYVESGKRSLHGFAELVGHSLVDWPGGADDPFFNVNSPEDLAEAERRLAS